MIVNMGPAPATNVNWVVCTKEERATSDRECGYKAMRAEGTGGRGRGNGVRLIAYGNGVSGVGVELIYLVLRYEDRRIGVGQVNNSRSSSYMICSI